MARLAPLASDDRLDALRPFPSGLQRHAGRACPTHPHDLDLRLVGRPGLIWRVEAACFHTGHRSLPSVATFRQRTILIPCRLRNESRTRYARLDCDRASHCRVEASL